MVLKEKYDVIIVGAGPAGAGAAKALTGSGLSTLIVERDELPRYKMCSGIVFPSSRKFIEDNFGELPDKIKCSPAIVKGNRICLTHDSPIMDAPFSMFDEGDELEQEGFNTRRADLDYWLCRQSDADIQGNCRFSDVEKKGKQYLVHLIKDGEKISVRTDFLIGADGTMSRVRKKTFPGFDDTVGLLPNYEEIYTGSIDLDPGWLYLFMDERVTEYFATVFHKDDKIVLVTGVRERSAVKDYFQAFRTYLEEKHGLKVKETVASRGIVLTDMSATRNYCLGKEGILLAGEAGGFLRGGEGITSSLISGKAAGDAVVEAVQSGAPAIDCYQTLAREEMDRCNKVHENLAAVLGYNVFMRGTGERAS